LRNKKAQYRPGPVDESPRGDTAADAPLEEPARNDRNADAFMDLVRTAPAHAGEGQAAGDDRYLVHLLTRRAITGCSTPVTGSEQPL
jgi:hypothetical protein